MITSNECDLMAHALGHESYRGAVKKNKAEYRNYFAAGPDGDDNKIWEGLSTRGLAELSSGPRAGYPYNCWTVTERGKEAIELFILAPKDALGDVLDPVGRYYLEEGTQVVGNCVLWWCPDRAGYTCDLSAAGIYDGNEASSIVRLRGSDHAWPEDYILARVHRHVRVEPLDRVRVAPKKRAKPPTRRRKDVSA